MEELLSLKWNNHRSTFLHILSILRDKQLYTDATLACEGRFYSVHRLVLSTCSDYFSAMFDRTTCKNPIIVLKDIKCEDLEALLDYMYLGEVNVRQADLASLIKAAECLRVKGLAVPDDEPPTRRGGRGAAATRGADGSSGGGGGSPPAKRKRRDDAATQDGREDVRPAPAVRGNRSPSQSSSRLSPPVGGSDGGDTKVGSPSGGLTQRPASSDHLSRGNSGPADSGLEGDPTPFVKVEQEDTSGDDIGGGGEAFDVHNDSFKEEAKDDHIDELSNDLPEFLQQSGDNSYPPSFAGTSFQPDLQNWQGGDQVLSSNNFSGLGFPSQSQESSPNTSGNAVDWNDGLAPLPPTGPESSLTFETPSFSTPCKTRPLPIPRYSCPPSGAGAIVMPSSSVDSAGRRRYSCPHCLKAFTTSKDCRRHMVIHSGEKPFHCPFCDHKANLDYNLKKHIFNKHSFLRGTSSN